MGKVVMDTNQIITNNIKKINESSVSEYSRFIEGRPFFTTYMNQNVINSTYDKGTQNIERIGSGNSAVKFNVIKELPIFNIDSLSLNTDYDDIGITSNIEGEGIIPPDTIKPLPNDLFIIDVISDKIIFKVTKVDVDSIRNKPFYKISFKFSKKLKDTESYTGFLNGAITDEYDFIYDNIGTHKKSTIIKDNKVKLDQLDIFINYFIDQYTELFYNKTLNMIIYPHNEFDRLYSRELNIFINHHELLKTNQKRLMEIGRLTIIEKYAPKMDSIYDIFTKNEFDIKYLTGNSIKMFSLISEYPFNLFRRFNFFSTMFIYDYDNYELTEEIIQYDIYEKFKKLEITNNTILDIIIKYCKKEDIELTESFFNQLDIYKIELSLFNFYFIPILIFILKKIRNILLNSDYNNL